MKDRMQPLIVATSSAKAETYREITRGTHQRLDYVELARRLSAEYVESNIVRASGQVRRIEELARLDVRLAIRVAGLVRANHCDLVISMSERVGIPLGYMLDRRVKHIVIAFHPLSPLKLKLLEWQRFDRRWDRLIVLTKAEARALRVHLRLGRDQVVALHNWVDTQFFKQVDGSASPARSPYALSAGLSQRDYPTLAHALRQLPHVQCEVKAGSTWVQTKALHKRVALPSNLHLSGPIPPSELRSWYQASRFVVVPIRPTSQWSAGATAVLEAQAMGKAVIATRTPGMSEYLIHGQTGLLVDAENPAALADAIAFLWNNPDKANEMGERARAWIEANFTLEQWLERFARIVEGSDESELPCVEEYQPSALKG
jgi:glycosyltransferase involved in cell wall biosynthesis